MEDAATTEIPFHAALALAGLVFVIAQALTKRWTVLRDILPVPVTAGLLGALLLLLPRAAGWPVRVPHQGAEVDVLIALLTTNMGLHLTPKVLRQGAPLFALFLLAGAVLYGLQLLAALPLAFLSPHPLETAVLTGPLSFLGAPYNLNPPSQVPPVADLLRPAFPQPEESAQGLMMLGVLLGPLLASWSARRFFRHAGEAPTDADSQRETPQVSLSEFASRLTRVLALILLLIAVAFGIQTVLIESVTGFRPDYLPVILISYLLGVSMRLLIEILAGPGRFPEVALTALLLGPTMGFVLTYAILSVPLHLVAEVTWPMAAAGLMAMLMSVALAWALRPVFSRLAGAYYGAVIATAFIAVTTAWGPVAMSFLRRSSDEEGEVEPMPAILPMNAFFLLPWTVILLTRAVFSVWG